MSIDQIVEFLKTEKIKVSVFGEFSSGKTTFLNAFINEQILTVAYEPTTAVPTRIRYGKLFNILVYKNNNKVEHYFQPGEEEAIWRRIISRRSAANILGFLENQKKSIQSFMTQWTKEGEKANQVKEVVIELPLQLLINKIELIDTPGTNNEYTEHRKFTENVALDTDIAIMLLDGTHGGASKTEFEFMNQVNKHVHNSLIVINKMDLIDSIEEYDDVMNYLKNDSIPKHWEHVVNPKVFGLSSKMQLEDKELDNSTHLNKAFNSFMSELENMIQKNRGSILLERLGNPEKEILREARKLSKSEDEAKIHTALDKYDDLRKILIAAGLSTKSVENGIERIEQEQRKRFSSIEKNKNLFNELKDQENKLNIQDYFKKMTSLKNDMNTLGLEHAESDDEMIRIEEKLNKIESDRVKIESLLKKIDSLLVPTDPFIDSIPSAWMCFSEIESIGVSKHFDDDFKSEIKGYEKRINSAIKDHIKLLRKNSLLAIDESDLSKKKERINELYTYHEKLNLQYASIKEYQNYLKENETDIKMIYEQFIEEKKILVLEKRLEKINNIYYLNEWKNDFEELFHSLVHVKEINDLLNSFKAKKDIIQKYDAHLRPLLEKINHLLLDPFTSREELIELNKKIIMQPELSQKIINNQTRFSDYLGFFKNLSNNNSLIGILHIEDKVELVSYLVMATEDMAINDMFYSTQIHLKKKMLFLKHNYFTSGNFYRQPHKIYPLSMENIFLKCEYEHPLYLYLDGKYYCRKCGKAYGNKKAAIGGSIKCKQRNPNDSFKSNLDESLNYHKGVKRIIDDAFNQFKSKKMYKRAGKSKEYWNRNFSSIDMLWEMSKKLNTGIYKKSINHKVLESFYNIPFRKGHFNSSIIEHPFYHEWIYTKLHYLETIDTDTLHNNTGYLPNSKIAFLNKEIKFLNNVNEINQPIIGNNNYISISKHLTALINPYKELRRKFYLGFITVALLICSLFLDNPFNKDLETRRYYSNRDKIFHKYLNEKDLKMAFRVNTEINDYNMKLTHFIHIDNSYRQLIKDQMKKSGIFSKKPKHTIESRREINRRDDFIAKVRKHVKYKDAYRFQYGIKE